MTRLPVVVSFLLFLALAATFAYWIAQWTAPPPHAVSAPPKSERTIAPVSAAAGLFGARAQGTSMANVQLRGVVHSGRSSDSLAIIVVEGKPARALRVNSEIAPGVKVKQILSKTVVVSEQGAERELSLPAFAAQEGTATISQSASPPPANTLPANPPVGINPGATGSGGDQGSGPGAGSPATPAGRPQ
jgi:general secretion pathway protein C